MILAAIAFVGAFCIANVGADANAEDATYEIQYSVDGAVQSFTGTSATVTLKSLEELGAKAPEGKTFAGWEQDGTGITVAVGSTVTLKGTGEQATKFIAKFVTTQVVITFVDGTETIKTETIDYNSIVTGPEDPEKEGYVFEGWNPDIVSPAKESATYTAQWRQIFDVTWVVDGTTISTGTTESILTMEIPADPVKAAHQFTGWFDKDGKIFDEDYEFTAAVTFTAAFRADTYVVTFVYGDDETVFTTQTVEHGALVSEPVLPKGYVAWDYDFSKAVTGAITIKAIAAEPAPGMSTGTQIMIYIAGVIIVIGLLMGAWGIKTGKIVIGKKKVKG